MSLLSRMRPTPPTRSEYFALFLAALANRGITPAAVDEEAFFLRMPEGNAVYLDNGFSEYTKARPAGRQGILDRYIAAALTVHETKVAYEEAEPFLLPVLRADNYTGLIALNLHTSDKGTTQKTAATPFAPGLVLCIVRDEPDTMMFINESTLQEWQISKAHAFQTALANLREYTDGPDFEEQAPGLFKATWKDGYGTSRVALPELFRDLALDGDPVFFAPTRDLLWVTGHRDSFNQGYMLKLGEEAHFDSYPLSPNLYRLRGDAWELFRPDDAEVQATLHGMRQRRATLDYQQQKQMLDTIFERDGHDIFVARHNLYEDHSGELFSMCVWARGADPLLPVTDRIVLFIKGDPDEQLMIPWQVALTYLPGLLQQDPAYVPARFRVRQFPSPGQWRALQRRIAQAETLQ